MYNIYIPLFGVDAHTFFCGKVGILLFFFLQKQMYPSANCFCSCYTVLLTVF